ncbi:MAG: dihydropteroate synthase [Desulfovibrionaceae bacterium]
MTLSTSTKKAPQNNGLYWGIKDKKVLSFTTPPIMAIVNYTSHSFIPSTVAHSTHEAVVLCKTALNEGANIIDIGVQSTKPDFVPMDPKKEALAIATILDAIKDDTSCENAIISVDTFNAPTATVALQKNCSIINDISGLQLDPALIDVIQHYKPGYVLTHFTRNNTSHTHNIHFYSKDILLEIKKYFSNKINDLLKIGLPEHNIVLDIGIGFGKNIDETMVLLRSLQDIASLGRPLLIALSYKTFYQEEKNASLEEKENATQVITALLASQCFCIHRVHNVKKSKQTLALTNLLT